MKRAILFSLFPFAATLGAASTYAMGKCAPAVLSDDGGVERVIITQLDGAFSSTTTYNGVTKSVNFPLDDLKPGKYLLAVRDLAGNEGGIEYIIAGDAAGHRCNRVARKVVRARPQANYEPALVAQQRPSTPPLDDQAIACLAKQYVDETVAPAVKHVRLVRARLDEFRKGKRPLKEGYQLYRMQFTNLKLLAPLIGQVAGLPSYDENDKYRTRIAVLIPGLMAKNTDLSDTTVASLNSEVATVDTDYKKLTAEHRELFKDPAASWGWEVADLELSRYDDRKLTAAEVTPEGLFPCFSAAKRAEAMQMLNFSLEMDSGNVFYADASLKEMNDRLAEYHAGKRPFREGYIVLWLLNQQYSMLYSALHNGASHHPYEKETARLMRYRAQTDPKLSQYAPDNLKKKLLETSKELHSLLEKHPELSQVREFGLNTLHYLPK